MNNITVLHLQDWQSWKNLRLEALKNAPLSFASSFEEEAHWHDDAFKQTLTSNTIYGAMYDGELIGAVGFYPGVLWGLYVREQHRNKGVADKLLRAVITYARTQVKQLYVTVVTTNTAAIALYQKHGFKIYGTDIRSLKVDGQFYDEYLMVLEF